MHRGRQTEQARPSAWAEFQSGAAGGGAGPRPGGAASSLSRLPDPDAGAAWFFDFDGTLADIAPTPGAARAPAGLVSIIASLLDLDLAAAVVSGRPLAEIDALLAPLRLPVAGVHGGERRDASGRVHRVAAPRLEPAIEALAPLCLAHPELLCEVKPGAIALHYRRAPELEPLCLAAMQRAAGAVAGMSIMRGKMVVELKPAEVDKGSAVRAFLAEPPFRGRLPWYFGDDVTDEPAFRAVQQAGGVGVKIGAGDTCADYRLALPVALYAWLDRAVAALSRRRRSDAGGPPRTPR